MKNETFSQYWWLCRLKWFRLIYLLCRGGLLLNTYFYPAPFNNVKLTDVFLKIVSAYLLEKICLHLQNIYRNFTIKRNKEDDNHSTVVWLQLYPQYENWPLCVLYNIYIWARPEAVSSSPLCSLPNQPNLNI